jgi:arabinose-5-phosphate isomerase
MTYLEEAKRVIINEVAGINEVSAKLDSSFEWLIETLANSKGRVVMCGMGKSGHIAKKIFATFVSTGTPSMFMHPAEAFHGDLGMIQHEDIFFAISNSGETSEITQLLPFIKANGNTLVSMTGNINSTLAQISDFHLDIGVKKEACPLNLAPTTSTTVSLVLGDAIAVSLMQASNFQEENFAKYHPGGALGRKLLLTVKDTLQPTKFVSISDDILTVSVWGNASKQ